jgi:hypothetical protein
MVRPGDGRVVLIEGRRKLIGAGLKNATEIPPAGIAVKRTTYINRRIACGDLVIVPAPAPAPVAATAAPPAPPATAAQAAAGAAPTPASATAKAAAAAAATNTDAKGA